MGPTREDLAAEGPRGGRGQRPPARPPPQPLTLGPGIPRVDKGPDFHRAASDTFSFRTVLKINLAEGRVSQRRSDRYILFYIR